MLEPLGIHLCMKGDRITILFILGYQSTRGMSRTLQQKYTPLIIFTAHSLWDSHGLCNFSVEGTFIQLTKCAIRGIRCTIPFRTMYRLSLTAALSVIYVKMLAVYSRQMSIFHAICNLVSTIGKCFQMQISKQSYCNRTKYSNTLLALSHIQIQDEGVWRMLFI